jgi:hypothetical protein
MVSKTFPIPPQMANMLGAEVLEFRFCLWAVTSDWSPVTGLWAKVGCTAACKTTVFVLVFVAVSDLSLRWIPSCYLLGGRSYSFTTRQSAYAPYVPLDINRGLYKSQPLSPRTISLVIRFQCYKNQRYYQLQAPCALHLLSP